MDNIEIYQAENGEIEFHGDLNNETIWANLNQIANLFNRDKSVISRHIKNIFKNGELNTNSVVAIFATTASDGKTYQVEYYNLDMILSIGYRVDSKEATIFRKWATSVLKQYITNGYAINSDKITHQRFKELENTVSILRDDMHNIKSKIKEDNLELEKGIFHDGQIYDAYAFINKLLKDAKSKVTLIDNYCDDTVLTIFSKYPKLQFTIITKSIDKKFKLDIKKYNSQYNNLEIKLSDKYHDRFLIIDNQIYHIGASLKDLGKKVFAFSKMSRKNLTILEKL